MHFFQTNKLILSLTIKLAVEFFGTLADHFGPFCNGFKTVTKFFLARTTDYCLSTRFNKIWPCFILLLCWNISLESFYSDKK